jgi:hypothetical protein
MAINTGSKGPHVASLQRSINNRLRARSAQSRMVKVDGEFGPASRRAMCYAAYLLGADKATVDGMRTGSINDDEVNFVRHPARRSDVEKTRGKKRVAAHRAAVAKQKAEAAKANIKRQAIVKWAKQAAANYRKNPGAYHYLAGGIANLIFLAPSPHNFRSDCSQFGASVYHAAGLPSPASVPHEWASTFTMVKAPGVKFVDRAHRKPGMLGMYGTRTAPHHVEVWCGDEFVGHGSPPIDSLTPGEPDYYLDFPFLN